ncbi:MAG: MATE family efflux transporter [Pseudomonadota bacterium]
MSQSAPTQSRTQALLNDPPLPLLLRLASPNVMAFLVQALVSIAETWFIGQRGTTALAAIALVFPWLMLMQMMANGALGGAVTSAIARALGSDDRNAAERLIWNAIALAVAAGVFFAVVGNLLTLPVLRTMTDDPQVFDAATNYARLLFFGAPLLWCMAVLSACHRGTGNMRLPALVMIGGALLQIPLSGAFILGWGGAPELGVEGAIASFLVIATLSVVVLLAGFRGSRSLVPLSLATAGWRADLVARILSVGLPSILSPVFTVATISGINYLVEREGVAALAGYGIGSRIEFLLIPMMFGIGVALNALVGTNLGAGQIERAHRIGWLGVACAATLTGTVGGSLAIWPELWAGPFAQDQATLDAAVSYLRICGPAFLFQGIGLVLYFGSQGAGRVGWPIVATVLRFAIAVGGGILLAEQLDASMTLIFGCIAAGMVVYGGITAAALRLGMWR